MPKLQRIKRSNGSLVYSVNLPLEIIEELAWEKGIDLDLEIQNLGNRLIIMISKKEDDSIKMEENENG